MRTIATILIAFLCSIALPASAVEFSVLSYNVYLRAPTWIFHNDHDWRAEHISAFLEGYDAVVLQEAFSTPHRERILSSLSVEYPFRSGLLGEDGLLTYNGGVIILSRWPIQRNTQFLFDNCEGSDCMVQKGVVYSEIRKEDETIHLFGLHMQAQKEYAATRQAQFPQLRKFIDAQTIPDTELVLVAGDFNVDSLAEAAASELDLLTSSAGLQLSEPQTEPSYDVESNSYVEEPVRERLDYIFYSSRHFIPEHARYEVLHFRVDGIDLSDHHPVAGHFITGNQL